MSVLENLEPNRVFYYFEEICKIPHGSGNTDKISNYLVNFALDHHLDYIQDEYNNIIIRKPGSNGYEDSDPVIIQGHMDMVCEKESASNHDFEKDGLKLVVEDDTISAEDTTLGGDDGIAVACGLAILENEELSHPPLEMVFTVDEEIGLLGAGVLDFSQLKGRTMINVDSEEEGILYISCAGGMICTSQFPVRFLEGEGIACRIQISGLIGGHSGMEIYKCGANAHILMGRLLFALKEQVNYQLVELSGGKKETAIPRECSCVILIQMEDVDTVTKFLQDMEADLRKEYAGIESELSVRMDTEGKHTGLVVHPVDLEKILFFLNHVPNGVQKMSGTIDKLVETSNNIGGLSLTEEGFEANCAPRSSVESARDYVASKIQYLTEFLGGEYTASGKYPAWEYKEDSRLQKIMSDVYQKVYGKPPVIQALHAGLECGIFYENIPDLDCVSIGPDVLDVHTTKEHMSISSVKRTYEYLLEVLESLK